MTTHSLTRRALVPCGWIRDLIFARLSRSASHYRFTVAQQPRHVAQHRARVHAKPTDGARTTLTNGRVGVGERRHWRT